jgi:hypothetical protein
MYFHPTELAIAFEVIPGARLPTDGFRHPRIPATTPRNALLLNDHPTPSRAAVPEGSGKGLSFWRGSGSDLRT